METKEDQHFEENDEKSTLGEERESEEASEFDDLFESEQSDEAPTREEYNRLLKGVKKLASQVGREKKEVKEIKEVEKIEPTEQASSPVLKSLYFKANPEAQEIWTEVEKEAKLLGKDPFTLYESSSYFKGEAKARAEAKAEDEVNKTKIGRPSPGMSSNGRSFAHIDLSNKEDIAWLNAKSGRRQEYSAWYATHK